MPFVGEITALIAAFLWAGSSILFTEATIRVGSISANLLRIIFAVLTIGLTVAVFRLETDVSNTQLLYLALSGAIGLVVGDGSLMKAFAKIGPRISMLIYALSPGMAALMALIFLGEVISFWGVVGMIITIIGVAVVVFQKNDDKDSKRKICWSGILYALLGGFGQAVGLIFAKQAFNLGEINELVATLFRVVGSLVFLYPFALFYGSFRHPIKLFRKERKAFYLVIIGTFFSTYLGVTLSLVAIANTYVGIASTLMSTVPIIMLPLSILYYKEKLSFASIAGIAILFLK